MRLSGTPSVSLRLTLDKPTANLGVLLVDYGQDTRIDYRARGLTFAEGLKLLDDETASSSGPGTGSAWY